MLELDTLLNRFIDDCYVDLDAGEQNEFDDLLAQSDVDLYAWFTRRETPPTKLLAALIERVRNCSV
jgi:antitoxin CptB